MGGVLAKLSDASQLLAWVQIGCIVIGGVFAFSVFLKRNRIKAAEIVLKVEEEYQKYLNIFLAIEYDAEYEHKYEKAIANWNKNKGKVCPDTNEQHYIDAIDSALRHLFVCIQLRNLGVDCGALDRLHSYYLGMLISDQRELLSNYVKEYWEPVYDWGRLLRMKGLKRIAFSFIFWLKRTIGLDVKFLQNKPNL